MIDNIKKIAISGGNGKMGNLLSEHIKSKDSFEVSGIYDPIAESKEYKKKIVEDFHAEKLTIDLKPYYFSNSIARCSKTMIECNNSKFNFKSTGTEG